MGTKPDEAVSASAIYRRSLRSKAALRRDAQHMASTLTAGGFPVRWHAGSDCTPGEFTVSLPDKTLRMERVTNLTTGQIHWLIVSTGRRGQQVSVRLACDMPRLAAFMEAKETLALKASQ